MAELVYKKLSELPGAREGARACVTREAPFLEVGDLERMLDAAQLFKLYPTEKAEYPFLLIFVRDREAWPCGDGQLLRSRFDLKDYERATGGAEQERDAAWRRFFGPIAKGMVEAWMGAQGGTEMKSVDGAENGDLTTRRTETVSDIRALCEHLEASGLGEARIQVRLRNAHPMVIGRARQVRGPTIDLEID